MQQRTKNPKGLRGDGLETRAKKVQGDDIPLSVALYIELIRRLVHGQQQASLSSCTMAPKYLPPEIIIMIFSNLDPDTDRQVIFSLCRASRTFYQLAQPFLFRSFSKGAPNQVNDFGPLALFTRSILTRPDLGNQVRRIVYHDIDTTNHVYHPPWPEAYSSWTIRVLEEGIQRLNIADLHKHRCATGLMSHDIHPLLRILFANLPKLQELGIALSQERSFRMGLLFNSLGGMLDLRKIHLRVEDESEWGILLTDVLPMMKLPRLEHFAVNHCTGDWRALPNGPIPQKSLDLSTMVLDYCALDLLAMNNLVNACRQLTSLTYICRPLLTEYLDQLPLNATQLSIALIPQQKSLTHLNVRFDDLSPELVGLQHHTKFQTLRPLSALKCLHVEQSCLTESPELPGSLETLVLESCNQSILGLVDYLVHENIRSVPHLRKVVIRPIHSPCARVLGIHPSFSKQTYEKNESVRRAFGTRVHELDNLASFGYFEFTVECRFYQAARDA